MARIYITSVNKSGPSVLIFPAAVFVGGVTVLVGLEEDDLADAVIVYVQLKVVGPTSVLRQGRGGPECLLVSGRDAVSEAGEDDSLDCSAPFEKVQRLGDCNLCRLLDRIPVKPATYRRERYRPQPVFDRERKRGAVAPCQHLRLSKFAALPPRPDRVNDVLGRQAIPARNLCLARVAAGKRIALRLQLRAGGPVDGKADRAAGDERRVRRVDDGVNRERGDVPAEEFELRHRQT